MLQYPISVIATRRRITIIKRSASCNVVGRAPKSGFPLVRIFNRQGGAFHITAVYVRRCESSAGIDDCEAENY